MISFFFSFLMFLEKGTIIYVPIMVDGRIKNHMVAFYFSLFSAERLTRISGALFTIKKLFSFSLKVVWEEVDKVNKDSVFSLHMQ